MAPSPFALMTIPELAWTLQVCAKPADSSSQDDLTLTQQVFFFVWFVPLLLYEHILELAWTPQICAQPAHVIPA